MKIVNIKIFLLRFYVFLLGAAPIALLGFFMRPKWYFVTLIISCLIFAHYCITCRAKIISGKGVVSAGNTLSRGLVCITYCTALTIAGSNYFSMQEVPAFLSVLFGGLIAAVSCGMVLIFSWKALKRLINATDYVSRYLLQPYHL